MMENKELLKKQIVYRSTHRGTKEMDILLGGFVKKYVEQFDVSELIELKKLLFIDDEIIYNWYLKKDLMEDKLRATEEADSPCSLKEIRKHLISDGVTESTFIPLSESENRFRSLR